jgi:hypothetical protein
MTEKNATKKSPAGVCRSCENYYITHDPNAPYGCRALGFKSRKNPAAVVLELSGLPCQLYTAKGDKAPDGAGGGHIA